MSFFSKILKKGDKSNDVFKNSPALQQMMKDLERDENEFIERLEKIMPVIIFNSPAEGGPGSSDGCEHKPSESTLPVVFPINFDDDLSISLRVYNGTQSEVLLNRHIIIAKDKITPDQMVSKAFGNLFKQIEKSINISMITEEMGMLSGCNGFESSLVLVNEIWKLIRENLKTDEILFGIPARDLFIFTAAGSSENVERLDARVRELYADSSHPEKITDRLYVMHKDGKSEIYKS